MTNCWFVYKEIRNNLKYQPEEIAENIQGLMRSILDNKGFEELTVCFPLHDEIQRKRPQHTLLLEKIRL